MIHRFLQWIRMIFGRLIPRGDLVSRTIRSGVWEIVINISGRILQLITLIILANLLEPRDFGLMGIVLVTLASLNRFSMLGINQALIQRKEDNIDSFLDTAWSMQLLRGVSIAAIIVLIAPGVAAFFNEPRVTELLRFVAISPLLLGIRNPGIVYFEKDLEFHKKFAYLFSGNVAEFVVALTVGVHTRSVWALVLAFVAADIVHAIGSYLLHPYRPSPVLDISRARELFSYGKWITATNGITFLLSEGDDIVVGWLLGSTMLGYYQIAYRLGNAPASEITGVIGDLMFSFFSKVQDDLDALRRSYIRTIQVTSFVAAPMTAGIFVVTPTFVRAFLGTEWLPVIAPMRILCLYGFVLSILASFGPLWKAIGHPSYITKVALARLVPMVIVVIPIAQWAGVEGIALMLLVSSLLVSLPFNLSLLYRHLSLPPQRVLRELAYPVVASCGMGFLVTVTRESVALGSPKLEFLLLVLVGIGCYILSVGAIVTVFDWDVRRHASTLVSALK